MTSCVMAAPPSSISPASNPASSGRRSGVPLTDRRRRLVEGARDLVGRLASRMARVYAWLLSRSELESLGNEGLVEAATRFRHSAAVPFEAYVAPRVRGAMFEG